MGTGPAVLRRIDPPRRGAIAVIVLMVFSLNVRLAWRGAFIR
jgi:hypothetical protein